MKKLLILGAGTAGTMMANRLRKRMPADKWTIAVVDQYSKHYYQPGFLFMPFGIYSEKDVIKPKKKFIPPRVHYIESEIDRIEPDHNRVLLRSGKQLDYDLLIIATGVKTAPDQTEGMLGNDWRRRVFDFYTFEGALALHNALRDWNGGKLVVHISEMPIKCPVAPLEFAFLADWWLSERGLRDKTEISYVTPLSGAFTKPIASKVLAHLLEEKGIKVVTDFNVARIDNERHTLQSKQHQNIFVIGDATDLPSSKAGSVAHFESEVLAENIVHYIKGEPLESQFDGHANCFIESGYHKAFLLDFNYDLQPVPGKYPLPFIGPFSLLRETHMNDLGKLAFKWIYWNLLLKGVPMPGVGHEMSRLGKQIPTEASQPA